MGDLKSFIPVNTETVQRIYDWHKQQGDADPPRGYLGASILGHHCDRYLWYTFRGCVARDFSGRLYRLFETGDLAEPRFVAELRAIGCEVRDTDEDGEQFAVYALGGHVSGHMDGAALGISEAPKTWHVCEFKTHSAKYFAALQKDGVQKSHPTHYAQMQIYMGLTGMERALYLAVNKDTDELYSERIHRDTKAVKALLARAERIIKATTPLERCSDRPDYYLCNFCDARDLCWGMSPVAVPIPARTCRSCCHATPEIDADETWARWSCAKHQRDLTPEEQQQGCDCHLSLPGLVGFATPTDAGDGWIEFTNDNSGTIWRHGQGEGEWTTLDLMQTPVGALGDKDIEAVRAAFGGTVEPTPLVDQYPPEDSEKLWWGQPADISDAIDSLGLTSLCAGEPARIEDRDGTQATEFVGDGRSILIVLYTDDNVAAIWGGKM